MSPIVVKDQKNNEKATYHGETRDQIKFPGQLEIVPPVQYRLWSLYEMARQKLN